jgi:hypothetical protein
MNADPLLHALEQLRELEPRMEAGEDMTAELHPRVAHLWAVVTAIDELRKREEEATPEAIREELVQLDSDGGFVFDPSLLQELAAGFASDGDLVNAETCAVAYGYTVDYVAWVGRSN